MSRKNYQPFVSIISPIRNEQAHIHQCLQSVIDQDYDNDKYELIAIDGMSNDQTREILKKYKNQFPNIKIYDNKKKIIPAALNIGLKAAKGEIIIRIDGHAFFEKDYIRQCIKHLNKSKAECVGGPIISIGNSFISNAIALAMSSPFGVGNAYFRTLGKEGFVDCVAFGAYQRRVFDKIGYFNEQLTYCEDDEFNYRLRRFGGKIFLTPKIKSYYYVRSNLNNLWRQYFRYGYWKIRVLQKHFKMMQPRQFVPPVFVFSLLTTGIIGIFSKPVLLLFLLIVISYVISCLYFSLKISFRKGLKYFAILPTIYFSLHTSYGLGFLWGLVRFLKYWKKYK